MQSGISASEELLSTFKSFTSDTSQRGFIVKIQNEKLVPTERIAAKSSFDSDLSDLEPLLSPTAAAYVILRRDSAIISVTYVPDSANVREKMLFASTRNTLIRELGGEKFAENIFATEKSELTAEGFKRHDAHVQKAAPLTEEERVLGEVRRAEAEASSGTQARKSHARPLGFPVSDDAVDALKGLNEGRHTLVQLAINVAEEKIYLVDASDTTAAGLHSAVSDEDPRYSFLKFTHTYQGKEESPIIMIYTCPSESKVKERMIYATSRRAITKQAEELAGLETLKTLEATSIKDITEQSIFDDLHPKKEGASSFARPKRPGRR